MVLYNNHWKLIHGSIQQSLEVDSWFYTTYHWNLIHGSLQQSLEVDSWHGSSLLNHLKLIHDAA